MSLISVETLIKVDHPIRTIKRMCDEVLAAMSSHFDRIYAADGAPSIPPETLLKGKVLQAFYTVRSDRSNQFPSSRPCLKQPGRRISTTRFRFV